MRLTDEQIAAIQDNIEEAGITLDSLKEDLLDHICCVIEHEMKQGEGFEEAYARAIYQLSPKGLDKIQGETLFLLNFNKIIRMKKVMYAIGLLSSICVAIGWFMLLLHLPGARPLFNYGFLALVLIFVPMLAFDRYKVSISQALSERLKIILGFASAFLTGLGVIFKMLHLMGANVIFGVGVIVFAFGFLPFLFFRMYKRSIE